MWHASEKEKIQWDTCFSQFPTIIISCKDNDVPLTGLWGGISWRRCNIQYSKWFVPWGNIGSFSLIVRVRDWVVLIELTQVMTSIKVVENSVSTMGNSPSQDYPHPDYHNYNNMISSTIWSKEALVNFSKTTNCTRRTGFKKQFCSLWKIYSRLLTPNYTRNNVFTHTKSGILLIK